MRKQQSKIKSNVKTISSLAVFSGSLLAATSAFMFFAPVIKTNADSNASTKVKATVSPVISLALDSNTMEFNITPTAAGAFNSQAVVATVNTNSTGGYELFFSSEDNTTTMTSLTSESTIASDFSGTVTSSTMAANKWGYSLDNTNFSIIPTLATPTKIKDLDHFPASNEKTTTVNIAVKADTSLPSGTYTKNVVFSAIAHPTPSSSNDMQSFECSSLSNIGDTVTLVDSRDGNEYDVRKLADGKCWMVENLRIADTPITSADSDVTEDYTIPTSAPTGFDSFDTTSRVYVDETYGGYYNWYAATAGTGVDISETYQDAPSSICPKGWRLPTAYHYENDTLIDGDASTLTSIYNSPESLAGAPNITGLGGFYYGDTLDDGYASYHTSTNAGGPTAYSIFVYKTADWTYDLINYNDTACGFFIRCVAD